jgi:hypothetical protein
MKHLRKKFFLKKFRNMPNKVYTTKISEPITTGFWVFAESGVSLDEGPFPLGEVLSAHLYRRRSLRREHV